MNLNINNYRKNSRFTFFHQYYKKPNNFRLLNYSTKLEKLCEVFDKKKGDLKKTFYSLMPEKRLDAFEKLCSDNYELKDIFASKSL